VVNNIPNDPKAEMAVLGCMLFSTEAIENVKNKLVATDFYSPINKKIYEKMLEIHNNNNIPDLITLSNYNFDVEYIANLANIVPTDVRLNHYIDIVYKNSIKRKTIKACHEIIDTMQKTNDNVEEIKAHTMQKIDIPINTKQENNDMNSLLRLTNESILSRKTKMHEFAKFGFEWLDIQTGGIRNSLTYLGARPSTGKSSFAVNIALNLMKQNKKIVFFSLEMENQALIERMLAIHGTLQYSKILKPILMQEDDWKKYEVTIKDLEKYSIKIYDNITTLEGINAITSELVAKKECDYVIIDHLHLMNTKQKANNTHEKVSFISRELKLMQMKQKIPYFVLLQLSRKSEEEKRPPRLTDLRESGSLEQDADNVFFLHADDNGKYEENKEPVQMVDIIIAKQRAGVRDVYKKLKYYKATQKFYDK